jgi:hypothetical protein
LEEVRAGGSLETEHVVHEQHGEASQLHDVASYTCIMIAKALRGALIQED